MNKFLSTKIHATTGINFCFAKTSALIVTEYQMRMRREKLSKHGNSKASLNDDIREYKKEKLAGLNSFQGWFKMPLSRWHICMMMCETKAIPHRMIALNHRHITELHLLIFMALILTVAFITFSLSSRIGVLFLFLFLSHVIRRF